MPTLSKYRVNVATSGMRFGEIVEIDAKDAHWKRLIDRGVLTRYHDPEPPRPARQGVAVAKPSKSGDDEKERREWT